MGLNQGSKGQGKGPQVGPKPVHHTMIADKDPYQGNIKRFQAWYTLLTSTLCRADDSWREVLKRLHAFPGATIEPTDVMGIAGARTQEEARAYQDELFRVLEQRTAGALRDALVVLGPDRASDGLKQWLRSGMDNSTQGQIELRHRITRPK